VKNKILLISVAVMLVIGLVMAGCAKPAPVPAPAPALAPAPAPAEPRVLKAIASEPVDFVAWNTMYFHMEEVERLSHGQLIIDLVGGIEVTPQQDQIYAVGEGIFDINYNAGADLAHAVPLAHLMPTTNMTSWEEYESGLWDLYCDVFAEQTNTYYLGNAIAPMFLRMGTKVPVRNLEEAQGLKVRAVSGELPFWDAVGMKGVLIGDMDLYTAFERGVVDTLCYPCMGWSQWGWADLVDYIVGPRIGFAGNGCYIINLDTWNSLSAEEQKWLTQPFIDKAELWWGYNYWLYRGEVWGEDSLKKLGIEFIDWPEEDSQKLQEAYVEIVYKENIKNVSPDIAKRFADIVGRPLPEGM